MTDDQTHEKKPIDIVSDDDWKSRVKAEDAARDAERNTSGTNADQSLNSEAHHASGEQKRAPKIDASRIPPVDFSLLVTMFSTQAMVALGLFPNPLSGEVEQEPALAKHYIDLLSVLEEKTKGNLSPEESQQLGTTLHELRMIYVQVSQATA